MALYEMRIYNVKVCVIENVHAGSEADAISKVVRALDQGGFNPVTDAPEYQADAFAAGEGTEPTLDLI